MERATYQFKDSSTAWSFMRAIDKAGAMAGFPSLDGKNSVQTLGKRRVIVGIAEEYKMVGSSGHEQMLKEEESA